MRGRVVWFCLGFVLFLSVGLFVGSFGLVFGGFFCGSLAILHSLLFGNFLLFVTFLVALAFSKDITMPLTGIKLLLCH